MPLALSTLNVCWLRLMVYEKGKRDLKGINNPSIFGCLVPNSSPFPSPRSTVCTTPFQSAQLFCFPFNILYLYINSIFEDHKVQLLCYRRTPSLPCLDTSPRQTLLNRTTASTI